AVLEVEAYMMTETGLSLKPEFTFGLTISYTKLEGHIKGNKSLDVSGPGTVQDGDGNWTFQAMFREHFCPGNSSGFTLEKYLLWAKIRDPFAYIYSQVMGTIPNFLQRNKFGAV
ncbi:hypothetical protein ACJX0J_028624, partial [Zea mays]